MFNWNSEAVTRFIELIKAEVAKYDIPGFAFVDVELVPGHDAFKPATCRFTFKSVGEGRGGRYIGGVQVSGWLLGDLPMTDEQLYQVAFAENPKLLTHMALEGDGYKPGYGRLYAEAVLKTTGRESEWEAQLAREGRALKAVYDVTRTAVMMLWRETK